jgi:hypothetical protein
VEWCERHCPAILVAVARRVPTLPPARVVLVEFLTDSRPARDRYPISGIALTLPWK